MDFLNRTHCDASYPVSKNRPLAFLFGGMLLAALAVSSRCRNRSTNSWSCLLLLKVGLGAGISVREADVVGAGGGRPSFASLIGVAIVACRRPHPWRSWPGVSRMDGHGDGGLFRPRSRPPRWPQAWLRSMRRAWPMKASRARSIPLHGCRGAGHRPSCWRG